jgi:hypothetical protein
MAVGRQLNLQGQWRLDVAHLRSIESAVAYDFDVLAGAILGGKIGYIVSGFTLYNSAGGTLIGAPKANVRIATADGTVIHYNGDYNGSVLMVPSSRAAEAPTLTTGAANYIGLNYIRAADASTADTVQFLNTSVNPPVEVARSTPLAQTLNYTIVVSPNDFSTQGATIVPVAKVTTDGGGNITAVVDARRMYLRLNQGGDATSAAAYTWGSRTVEDMGAFSGGDKDFGHERNWKTAMMTRIWELGGGLQWYSDTTDRNTKLCFGPTGVAYNGSTTYALGDVVMDGGITYYCILAGSGHTPVSSPTYWTSTTTFQDNFEFNGTQVRWDGLTISFATNTDAGTAATYNVIVSQAVYQTIADGYGLYVDVNRATDGARISPAAPVIISALGTPTVPGSRYLLAWRRGPNLYTRDRPYEAGRSNNIASTSVMGVLRTATTSYAPTTPYAIMAASAANKAAATGLTRTTISSGVITIGGEANDDQIVLSAVTGVLASATSGNNKGLQATGYGTGVGGLFTGGASAANISLAPRSGAPSTLVDGDIWYDSTGTDKLSVRINGGTYVLRETTPTFITPTLPGTWQNNFADSNNSFGYYKDSAGCVHLQGYLYSNTNIPGAIFTLPADYRPTGANRTLRFRIPQAGGSPTTIHGELVIGVLPGTYDLSVLPEGSNTMMSTTWDFSSVSFMSGTL